VEIEASHIAAVKDLQKLKNLILFLKNSLGKPDLIENEEKPCVLAGLRHLTDSMSN
jgi:hypothetical protein